jgi:hypothetical protein
MQSKREKNGHGGGNRNRNEDSLMRRVVDYVALKYGTTYFIFISPYWVLQVAGVLSKEHALQLTTACTLGFVIWCLIYSSKKAVTIFAGLLWVIGAVFDLKHNTQMSGVFFGLSIATIVTNLYVTRHEVACKTDDMKKSHSAKLDKILSLVRGNRK